MDLFDGLELYARARKERQEEKLYQAWVSLYPHFDKNTFISWEDYRDRHNSVQPPVVRKSAEELIAEAHDTRRQIEGR
jgi:hypothetical protein